MAIALAGMTTERKATQQQDEAERESTTVRAIGSQRWKKAR